MCVGAPAVRKSFKHAPKLVIMQMDTLNLFRTHLISKISVQFPAYNQHGMSLIARYVSVNGIRKQK